MNASSGEEESPKRDRVTQFWYKRTNTFKRGKIKLFLVCRDFFTMISSIIYAIGVVMFAMIMYMADIFVARENSQDAAAVRKNKYLCDSS